MDTHFHDSQILSGDEAVAWAAMDAGISISCGYPGTPATDIQECVIKNADPTKVKAFWSVNEKVAYESALAVAIGGKRALVSMKQVGLNVAADAFMNSCPAGVNAGFVLVVGDDPECHSSQNRQDTRHYRKMAGNILLEPSDSQEAYSMTRFAFLLSEQFRIPVIIRLTSRIAYGCTPVTRQPDENQREDLVWPKEPERFFIVPTVSRKLFQRLHKLQDDFGKSLLNSSFHRQKLSTESMGCRLGIVCTGVGSAIANEFAPPNAGILKIAGEPFPEKVLEAFVDQHDRIIVLEEGDPVLEERVRRFTIPLTIVVGRLSGELKPVGELQPSQVDAAVNCRPQSNIINTPDPDLPPRLPEICKPCGYNKVFAALKNMSDLATPSDIGCNSLGGLPPYSVMDGVWAMGSSIGIACGLAAAGQKRIVAIIGDSTFFHSGIPPLIEAVHEGYTFTILLLDNGTTAMTGGQGVAHRIQNDHQNKINLTGLLKALGVSSCVPFDPHEKGINGIQQLVEDSFQNDGVSILLYQSQCGIYSPGYSTPKSFQLKVPLAKER